MKIDAGSPETADYFLLDDLLTKEQRDIRDRVRSFCGVEVAPVINDYWQKEEFPAMTSWSPRSTS